MVASISDPTNVSNHHAINNCEFVLSAQIPYLERNIAIDTITIVNHIKVRLWVLMRGQTLIHLCVDISLIMYY